MIRSKRTKKYWRESCLSSEQGLIACPSYDTYATNIQNNILADQLIFSRSIKIL